MLKIVKRFIGLVSSTALTMGLFVFAPVTFAAGTLSFNQAPANFFNVASNATMDFFVKLAGYGKAVDINMNVYAVGYNEPVYNKSVSYVGDEVKKFAWDGKSAGLDMPPGDYKAVFSATGMTPLTHSFKIVPAGTLFLFDPAPALEYTTGGAPYKANVVYLPANQKSIKLNYILTKKGGFPALVGTHTFTTYGENYVFEWDGKIGNTVAPAGDYRLGIKQDGFNSAELVHDFTVKNPPDPNSSPALSFASTPAETLNIKKGELIDFPVKLANFEKNVTITFQIQPEGKSAYKVKDFQYTGNITNTFQWDGEYMGEDVAPGQYTAIFSGDGLTSITHVFNVLTAEPKIAFKQDPPAQHTLNGGDYNVSVALAGYSTDTKVTVSVPMGDDLLPIPQDEFTYQANGVHEFSWDVSDYDPGIYQLIVKGSDTENNLTNVLTYDFKIVEKAPKISFVQLPPTNYVVGQSYKASVELEDFTTDTSVDLFIYKNNSDPLVFSKVDNYVYKANGTHEFIWDGKMNGNQAASGDYEARLVGQDLDGSMTNILSQDIKLTANVVPLPDDGTGCAGYKDLKKTDWSCAAAEWAKKAGIMTGQQGGDYFDGYSYLNRAEMAKVALMAHQLYKAENDYCQAKKPFTDIPLGQWYTNYICLGKNIKMLTGYAAGVDAGKYVPARAVTLPEMFCILTRPLGVSMPQGESYSGLASNQWYSGCAKYVKDNGYFSATSILPTTEATRFNVLNFLYAMHQDGKI